jgi:AhpD family alkylhydroperoxidase
MVELIKIRSSQLNGCAYCLDMHTKDAIAIGESAQRLHVLAAWREAPFYSDRERAALAWCEALTLLSETGAPDDVYHELEQQFSPQEIMEVTFAIVTINSWNRLAVGLRADVGGYVSHRKPEGEHASA